MSKSIILFDNNLNLVSILNLYSTGEILPEFLLSEYKEIVDKIISNILSKGVVKMVSTTDTDGIRSELIMVDKSDPSYIQAVSKTFISNGFISAVVPSPLNKFFTEVYPSLSPEQKKEYLPTIVNMEDDGVTDFSEIIEELKK